jgi:hypothetical protein
MGKEQTRVWYYPKKLQKVLLRFKTNPDIDDPGVRRRRFFSRMKNSGRGRKHTPGNQTEGQDGEDVLEILDE